MTDEPRDTGEGERDEPRRTAADVPLPGGNFRLFVQRLSYQGLMSLGLIPNPLTNSSRLDLNHARMLIDDLAMLAEKTRGNLDEDESEHLFKVVRDLRHQYEQVKKGGVRPE
jgi:hypothetical protein